MLMSYEAVVGKIAHHLSGLKVEWESEGATLFDVVDLIRISARHSLPLFVKIGGYEAMRDLFDLYSLGVNGIIVPMVESAFGVTKALEAIDAVFVDDKIKITLTIESVDGVKVLPTILDRFHNRIRRITLGRTDLGRSLGKDVGANDPLLLPWVKQAILCANSHKIAVGIGGGISPSICESLQSLEQINFVETRHCIFEATNLMKKPHLIDEAFRFETAWLESRIHRENLQLNHYLTRINILKKRAE
jgi:hypothetical protein